MTCDTHLILRANAMAMTLTDRERIAFGVALIQTVLRTDRAPDVLLAAKHLGEHGEALLDADFARAGRMSASFFDTSHTSGGAETGTTHGTIEQWSPSEIPGGVTPGRPGRSLSSSLGAAWARIRDAEARLADSIWGDGIGAVCAVIFAIGLMFLPLILPAFEWGLK